MIFITPWLKANHLLPSKVMEKENRSSSNVGRDTGSTGKSCNKEEGSRRKRKAKEERRKEAEMNEMNMRD